MPLSLPQTLDAGTCPSPDLDCTLVLQPVMNIKMDAPLAVAHECLLRVVQGEHLSSASKVITSAEANGTIVDLDIQVISRAAQIAKAFPKSKLWVNVSQLSITDSRFVEHTLEEFKRLSVSPRMTLEITETADGDIQEMAFALRRLGQRAVTVMLDDFMEGHAKQQLLHDRHVMGCKLSRVTTREITSCQAARRHVERLVAACRLAGKLVVLEGIEQEKELQIARDLNIQLCQGFYFGAPSVPAQLLD